MGYQKIINLLDNTNNKTSKFKANKWTNNQFKFKNTWLNSSLCSHCDAYILAKGTIAIIDYWSRHKKCRINKQVVRKTCGPFTDCISKMNNNQLDNARHLDVVIPMYNLIEYNNHYAKNSGGSWQYQEIGPNDNITDSESSKFKERITGKIPATSSTKDVEIAV